eukprot:SAG22_NODE_2271_length_2767_cov_2.952547_4_plen_159_part_00
MTSCASRLFINMSICNFKTKAGQLSPELQVTKACVLLVWIFKEGHEPTIWEVSGMGTAQSCACDENTSRHAERLRNPRSPIPDPERAHRPLRPARTLSRLRDSRPLRGGLETSGADTPTGRLHNLYHPVPVRVLTYAVRYRCYIYETACARRTEVRCR